MRLTKKDRAQPQPKFSPFSRYIAARDRQIIAMGRQGHTAREIALGMGVSLATVYRVGAKNGGLSFRSARERKRNNHIVILFRQNWAAQEIADAVGCSLATVYRVVAKSGYPLLRRGKFLQRKNRERNKRILALRHKGWRDQAIATLVGCSVATVYRVTRKPA